MPKISRLPTHRLTPTLPAQTKLTQVQEQLDLYVELYRSIARRNGFGAHLLAFGVPQSRLSLISHMRAAWVPSQLGLQQHRAMHGRLYEYSSLWVCKLT